MVSQNVSPMKQLFKPGTCFVFMKRVEEKSSDLLTLPAFSIFEQSEKEKMFSGIIFAH